MTVAVRSPNGEAALANGYRYNSAVVINAAAITERSFGVPDGVSNGQFGIGLVIDFFGLAAKNSGFPVEFAYPSQTAIVPANIALVNGAKKNKLGMQFKSGVFVDGDADLIIEPQKSIDALMLDQNFRMQSLETVNKARVVRTRPYLKQWQAAMLINFDDTVVNRAQIEQALEIAGRLVGCCERRPKFGRFTFTVN